MYGYSECVYNYRQRDRGRKKEEGGWKWDRKQQYKISPFLCLLPLRGNEGGHPRLQALNQPADDLACPGYCARSLRLSACYIAILLPSLCSWCQVTAPLAQRCHSMRCHFSARTVPKFSCRQLGFVSMFGLREAFDKGYDKKARRIIHPYRYWKHTTTDLLIIEIPE